jgi:hypothetical protein
MNAHPITEKVNEVIEGQNQLFTILYSETETSAIRNMISTIKASPIPPIVKKELVNRAIDLEMTVERRQIEQAYIAGCTETIEMFVKMMKQPNVASNLLKLSAKQFIDAAEQFYLKKYDV